MAKAKRKSNGSSRSKSRRAVRPDAIELLKTDHREVTRWFEQFKKARGQERKIELARMICSALKVHTIIEEEIFYPAFLEATSDKKIHHEAEVEHEGAKQLIAQIEQAGADDFFDARVNVLAEMIRHHVSEEEKRDGMFAEARAAEMDLESLGRELKDRKDELMGERTDRRGMDELARPGADH